MIIKHKGYIARVSVEGDALLGSVVNAHSLLSFEGHTVPELREAFAGTVDEYLLICEERGMEPDKGYSGTFLARLGCQLHNDLAVAAADADLSMNAWLIEAIREKLTHKSGATVTSPEDRIRDLEEV